MKVAGCHVTASFDSRTSILLPLSKNSDEILGGRCCMCVGNGRTDRERKRDPERECGCVVGFVAMAGGKIFVLDLHNTFQTSQI